MRWIQANEQRAIQVGLNLRKQDELEVSLSHGLAPVEACMLSYRQSQVCQAIEGDDGSCVALTGVVGKTIWLLGSTSLTATKNHRLQLCRYGREWVDFCLESAGGYVENMVYYKNKRSIRWLKHLGFTVQEPEPFGPSGALFCPFWRYL